MPSATERGPSVPDQEELFRAITVPDWWLADPERPRPRSAAFSYPSFSTNIASMILLDGAIRHLAEVLHRPNGAIVGFSCRVAKELGFDPRQELAPIILITSRTPMFIPMAGAANESDEPSV